MYYFLNTTMPINKSGIEHAQIKRVHLFNSYNVPNKIVTRNFELDLHRNLKIAGIDEKNHLNLFEFLQGSGDFEAKALTAKDIKRPEGTTMKKVNDEFVVTDHRNRLAMKIKMWEDQSDQVSSVEYYDYANNLLKRERYDRRGFMSIAEIHNPTGATSVEQIFTPSGKLVYESFYFNDGQGEIKNSLLRIVDYQGKDYEFNGLNGFQRFLFDEINKVDDGKNVFIADRSAETEWGLLHMETKAYRVLFLHSAHTSDPYNPQDKLLNNNFDFSLRNFKYWNGIIDSTPHQTADMKARFDSDVTPIYTIPVGIVPNDLIEEPKVKFENRVPGKIIVVARLFPEKRLDHLLNAFKIVHEKFPEASLDFWGYGDGETDKKLKEQVSQLKLNDSVKFKGYSDNIGAEMDKAQISTLTSSVEGFALAVLEAQSHGLPVVSYDIPYGPSDIIQDGISGTLIKSGDYKAFADALMELLGDDKKLKQYSEAAYKNRERFSEAAIWKDWQVLDQDAKKFFDTQK
ncbi:glycosyltransferase [Pediococcus claussenii]|uniref:Glycosyl transferase, group 1 n=1 Tax=Pediococcus claussenii (strain ATCC BAA-344 / DSM 14800 / JCM 18046 / KCTC 3811 / LMG 21948 / P06) TaxID=701521 RepID=G8PCF8_PEDCP|nr:glycosyltransferase [Pediococcus claussenii]AEV94943.1 Glycosyl transferase, group 1 [Pediococcus claussenii ATCC BAA-344]KRN19254.1 hypothetical protein IV79_GL001626 [Pediococcus claussenii]